MKLTVNKYLNARSGTPNVSSPNPFYLKPGTTIEIEEILIGEQIEGNSIWYRSKDDGCYYWSGGILEIEFAVAGLDLNTQREELRNAILSQAKQYYLFKYQNTPGFTGISIADKITGGQVTQDISLSFQVLHKQAGANYLIPAKVNFKGFWIYTDVVEADYARLQWAYPGDNVGTKRLSGSISRLGNEEWGSCGIKVEGTATDNAGTYILTNYHVAAADLLKSNRYAYWSGDDSEFKNCVMPCWTIQKNEKNIIGFLYKGRFDSQHDIALIKLYDNNAVTNRTPTEILLTDSLDIFNDNSYKNEELTMYGSNSGITSAVVISPNSTQVFKINGALVTKENLIQVKLLSQGGDSGGPILYNGLLIGLLIGADNNFSYILPIQRILNDFNLKIASP